MNWRLKLTATFGLTGVTAILVNVAAVTVSVVLPDISPTAAEITLVPMLNPVARPLLGRPLGFIVATSVLADDQVADVVTSTTVLSVKVASAMNCLVRPSTTLGFVGVTATDFTVAAVTVSVVLPVTPANVALICDVPTACAVAIPLVVVPLAFMVATVVVADTQVARVVKSCVVPSLKVPSAANCLFKPLTTDGLSGVTVIVVSVAAVTRRVVFAEMPERVAVITDVPAVSAEAKPLLAAPLAFMVATAGVADVHTAEVVTSCDVPSE